MKADPEVKMISAETPYLFSRACEMLVLDLTLRSWLHTEDCNRRTLQKGDIVTAVDHSADMDFLLDVLPKEPIDEELACDFYTRNDAAMYPLSVMNLPFIHEATSYGPNTCLQTIQGHVCEPESVTPFMAARPDLASDLLTYDPPKENGGLEEIVMTLMEAQPSIPCPSVYDPPKS
ncbi:uncharacterized protein LOC116263578 [Nymphaea colorata]|nr:uncharacterized protein LOC116263578 [Nymphaea colorata]